MFRQLSTIGAITSTLVSTGGIIHVVHPLYMYIATEDSMNRQRLQTTE